MDQSIGDLRLGAVLGHLVLGDRLEVEPVRVRGRDRAPLLFLCRYAPMYHRFLPGTDHDNDATVEVRSLA